MVLPQQLRFCFWRKTFHSACFKHWMLPWPPPNASSGEFLINHSYSRGLRVKASLPGGVVDSITPWTHGRCLVAGWGWGREDDSESSSPLGGSSFIKCSGIPNENLDLAAHTGPKPVGDGAGLSPGMLVTAHTTQQREEERPGGLTLSPAALALRCSFCRLWILHWESSLNKEYKIEACWCIPAIKGPGRQE